MKKLLCAVLTLCISVSSFSFLSVSAQNGPETLYDAVAAGIRDCVKRIDVERFGASDDELVAVMNSILNNEPEFFYIENRYTYSYQPTDEGISVLSVNINYTMTEDEVKSAREFVKNELNAILRTVPVGLDEYEKALYLHDYICLNFEYDVTYSVYDIYEMFKTKKGACQAYSLMYDALLERVGIESSAVLNYNHMWNQVRFGDKWYHVDVTWDDPINDLLGRVGHEYFLISDELISKTHSDYTAEYVSDDTSYDGFSWHECFLPIGFAGGETYLIDSFEIKRFELLNGSSETVYKINKKWHAIIGGTYGNCYSGLGSYGDLLIFNDEKSIKSLNPKTLEVSTLAVPEIGLNYIYRMYTNGNKAYFLYNTFAEYYTARTGSCDLPLEALPCNHSYISSIVPPTCTQSGYTAVTCEYCGDGYKENYTDPAHAEGDWVTLSDESKELRCTECGVLLDRVAAPVKEYDVNGDGRFNMFDYLSVKSTYFAGKSDSNVITGADVNGDGKLNMFDYLLVKNSYFKK